MNTSSCIVLSCVAAIGPVGLARAGAPAEGQWRWSVAMGASSPAYADAEDSVVGSIADLGALDPGFVGSPGTVTLESGLDRHVFGTGWSLGTEVTFRESDSAEGYARLVYQSLLGPAVVTVGQLASPGLATPAAVHACFGDLNIWDLAIGQRYCFLAGSRLRPYVNAGIGFSHTAAVQASYQASASTASDSMRRVSRRSRPPAVIGPSPSSSASCTGYEVVMGCNSAVRQLPGRTVWNGRCRLIQIPPCILECTAVQGGWTIRRHGRSRPRAVPH